MYGDEGELKVRVKVGLVAAVLKGYGKRYVTVREVSSMLGVSTRTAGRILARLEREGYVERYSKKAYRILGFKGYCELSKGPCKDSYPQNAEEEVLIAEA